LAGFNAIAHNLLIVIFHRSYVLDHPVFRIIAYTQRGYVGTRSCYWCFELNPDLDGGLN